MRQEKALHLDGSEKGPDATHVSSLFFDTHLIIKGQTITFYAKHINLIFMLLGFRTL
ncbi:hypothetical protein Bca4012_056132 [Brassica carinata]